MDCWWWESQAKFPKLIHTGENPCSVHLNPFFWQAGVALQRAKAMASLEHENHRGVANTILLSSSSLKSNRQGQQMRIIGGQQTLFFSHQARSRATYKGNKWESSGGSKHYSSLIKLAQEQQTRATNENHRGATNTKLLSSTSSLLTEGQQMLFLSN